MDKIKNILEKFKDKVLSYLSDDDIDTLYEIADKIKDKYHNFRIWFWGEDLPKDASVLFPDDEYQRWEQYQYYNELRKKLDRKRFFASIVLFIIGFNLLKFSFNLTKDIINIPFIACFGKDICAYTGAKLHYTNSLYPYVVALKNGKIVVQHVDLYYSWPVSENFYVLCKYLFCTPVVEYLEYSHHLIGKKKEYTEIYNPIFKNFKRADDYQINEDDIDHYAMKNCFDYIKSFNKDDLEKIKDLVAILYKNTNLDLLDKDYLRILEINSNKYLFVCGYEMYRNLHPNGTNLCKHTIFYDAENHIVKKGPKFPLPCLYSTAIKIGKNKIMFVGGEHYTIRNRKPFVKQNRVQIIEYRKGK